MDDRNDITASIQRYESYVRADPGNPLLWINLGDLYHTIGRFEEAIACFERCLHENPEFISARSRIASVMISQHRFAEAERVLRHVLNESPEDPNLLFNLGLALYFQERWSDAERSFAKSIALGQAFPEAHAYLARCLHRGGHMQAAIQACQHWLDSAQGTESRGYLALLHMDHGDMGQAHRLALEVLQQDPDNADAGIVAGTASMESQEIAAAEQQFARILAREPDNGRAWLGMGLVRMYRQEHPEAVTALQRAAEFLPSSSGVFVTLGWAKIVARDLPGAENVFRQALEVDRNFGEAHGGLATVLALQGRIDEARQTITRARRLNPQGFGAAFAQTLVLKQQGQEREAIDLLSNMLMQAPRQDAQSLIEQIRIYATRNPSFGRPNQKGPKQ